MIKATVGFDDVMVLEPEAVFFCCFFPPSLDSAFIISLAALYFKFVMLS